MPRLDSPSTRPARNKDWSHLLAVVGVGLGLTLALFLVLRGWETERRETLVADAAQDRAVLFQSSVDDLIHSLHDVARFIQNSNQVELREFAGFVRPILQAHPEILSVQWTMGAKAPDPHYRQVSPEAAGLALPEALRQSLLDVASATNLPAVSAPFRPEEGRQGILFALPVVRGEVEPAAPGGGSVILAAVDVKALFQASYKGTTPIGLDLVVRDAGSGELLLFWPSRSRPVGQVPDPKVLMGHDGIATRTLTVADRVWRVDFYPAPAFWQQHNHHASSVALALGLLASAVLGLSVRAVTRARREAEDRVRQRTREALERAASLRAIIDNQPFLVWLKDTESRFLAVNEVFARACNSGDPQDLVGKTDLDIWPRDLADKYRADDRLVMATRERKIVEEAIEVPDGRRRWFETFKTPVLDQAGHLLGTAGFARDITERKETEERLREAATVLQATTEAIMVTDPKGVIKMVNPAFTEITGYSVDEAVGQTPRLLKSGRHDPRFYERLWDSLRRDGHWEGEVWNRRKGGKVFPEWQSITAVMDKDGKVVEYVSVFSDITRRKLTEEEIRYRANFDPLTGLPNRSLLMERLNQSIKQSQREQELMAVLFLDLDHFKEINDTLGHA